MKLVSVIVPVYNSERYLAECLDSILGGSYSNIEVLLIDDGSTDGSAVICDQYEAKDSRVRAVHQKNGGVIDARNKGLEIASGEYIAFVDADDVVSPVIYEQLVHAMETEDADLAVCDPRPSVETLDMVRRDGYRVFTTLDDQLSVVMTAPWMRSVSWTSVAVWSKLYRKEKINAPFAQDALMCEDLKFNYDYIQNSRKLVVVPAGLYYYRQHGASIMAAYRKHSNNVINGITYAELICDIAESHTTDHLALREYLDARATYSLHGALWRVYSAGKEVEYDDFCRKARIKIRQFWHDVWKDSETYSIRIRCVVMICAWMFPLWALATKMFGWYLRKCRG